MIVVITIIIVIIIIAIIMNAVSSHYYMAVFEIVGYVFCKCFANFMFQSQTKTRGVSISYSL
jgi:hypothetical protein